MDGGWGLVKYKLISAILKNLVKMDTLFYRARKNLPPIKHSFDVWHFIKSILKDLHTAGKLKRCATLGLWQRSIKHQLWHCLANCNGNSELLEEMVLSIPKHITNVHTFPGISYLLFACMV